MIQATSGTVLVEGEDIQNNMSKIRTSLGYCPQHNVNFEELSVMDHFIFFAMVWLCKFM